MMSGGSSSNPGPSSSSFQLLSDAPLSADWNKENLPVIHCTTPSASSKGTPDSLKRPLGEHDLGNSAFKIKRRRGLSDRSFSLEDVENISNHDSSLGASPSFSNPNTPVRRFAAPAASTISSSRRSSQERPLQRSYSENNAANIIRSCQLADSRQDLTGDFTKTLSLPLHKKDVKHVDLNSITCHTLAKLMKGEYSDSVKRYRIIDARYAYEFEGGHIRGAESFGLWDEKIFFEEFLPENLGAKNNESVTTTLIFHCEFSSARGPALLRSLRKRDRCLNKATYPALYFPECYLLHNGYKEFFEHYPELCHGGYQPMNDPKFSNEEKMFRKKAKSWAAGTVARTAGGTSSRLLKL